MSSADEVKEVNREQSRNQWHSQNFGRQNQEEGQAAEILRYISDIDDLPISRDDPVMGQLISKLVSTANLTKEQVKSNEWVLEYLLVLYLSKHPPKYGMHGVERAIAHDDPQEAIEYLSAEDRMQLESFIQIDKLAFTRSEGFKAVEESTRNVNESVVRDDSKQADSGGLRGYLGI